MAMMAQVTIIIELLHVYHVNFFTSERSTTVPVLYNHYFCDEKVAL